MTTLVNLMKSCGECFNGCSISKETVGKLFMVAALVSAVVACCFAGGCFGSGLQAHLGAVGFAIGVLIFTCIAAAKLHNGKAETSASSLE